MLIGAPKEGELSSHSHNQASIDDGPHPEHQRSSFNETGQSARSAVRKGRLAPAQVAQHSTQDPSATCKIISAPSSAEMAQAQVIAVGKGGLPPLKSMVANDHFFRSPLIDSLAALSMKLECSGS